jgi:site-specific recombinase XerD
MKLTEAINLLCQATAAEGRSPRTVQGYQRNLSYLLRFLGDVEIEQVTITELRAYAAVLRARDTRYEHNSYAATQEGGLSPFSIAGYLRSVRRLFSWLTEEKLLKENPAQRLRIQVPQLREPKAISLEDFQALLDASQGYTLDNVRDRALLLLLADTGARAGGICNLHLGDVDPVRMTVRLTEKGQKTRIVPISPTTIDALRLWLRMRQSIKADNDFMFVTVGPRNHGNRLTETGLKEVTRRLAKQAGVTGRVNPHAFRHGFAREWIRNGGDLATLARILGHSDPSVTARFYSVFSDGELGDFHRRFSPVARLVLPPDSSDPFDPHPG